MTTGIEGTDWQSHIGGIGILEYVEVDNQDEFIGGINQFLDERNQFHQLHSTETHPRVPYVHQDLL